MGEDSSDDENRQKRVLIVGAGLVGLLEALFCAKRGYYVDVYEARPDPRKQQHVSGRSINLALSERGRAALRHVGAEEAVVETCVPMYGRMIHSLNGKRTPMPYDQCILSLDRHKLSEHLISLADKNKNICYHFGSKLVGADFDKCELKLAKTDGEEYKVSGDLIVGCDGAYSAVRRELMKSTTMSYSQFYIPHGYKEIEMQTDKESGDLLMEANYLHLWPRNEFMMIALPNSDRSFTCNILMPNDIFSSVHSDAEIMGFFEREFPDAIPLIGREKIIHDFKKNKASNMICIKASPYHYKDSVVIIGDAAHAMVPFYGQGMNCAFEDCLVLHDILDTAEDMASGLEEYSRFRNPDVEAIIDLSLYNYTELRAHVNSPLFALRKLVDTLLNRMLPNHWVPLFSMVAFTRTRYHQVIKRARKQDQIISASIVVLFGATAFSIFWALRKNRAALPNVPTSFLDKCSLLACLKSIEIPFVK